MAEGCRYLLSAVDMKKAGGETNKGSVHMAAVFSGTLWEHSVCSSGRDTY